MAASFDFKRFSVSNELSAQKVGTDGVLLGAWVALDGTERHILDVGTGTGVIALILAQRTESLPADTEGHACEGRHPITVVAIDIDAPSAREAAANFNASPWSGRMAAFQGDFRGLGGDTIHPLSFLKCPYDLIVSNPPFFTDSLKAPEARRSDARHSDILTFDDLLRGADALLSPEGRLAVIYPATEAERLAGEALSAGLFPIRSCRVSTKAGKAPKRIMMEFSRQKKEPLSEELFIHEGDGFSEAYKALTRDFYLKF
ncbi:MAG: methyltransferase domain-containing protein [Bacteroidales bacterium]|nr:methyltransferase domain-containing protein [Bacteroidales bacterium]